MCRDAPGLAKQSQPHKVSGCRSAELLAKALERLSSGTSGEQEPTTLFDTKVPTLSLEQYASRLARLFKCSDACFGIAFAYISRFSATGADCKLKTTNLHRLLLTSLLVAVKWHEDVYFNNARYAKVGGVALGHLNSLEADFLRRLDWRLEVSSAEYEDYLTAMNVLGDEASLAYCKDQHTAVQVRQLNLWQEGTLGFNDHRKSVLPTIACA
jgi:hypothetical protein